MADEDLHEQVEELASDLRMVAWAGKAAYLEAQVPMESEDDWTDTEIERTLLVSERTTDADGEPTFRLVARIWVHVIPQGNGGFSFTEPAGEATVARCFEYAVRPHNEVDHVLTECPDVEPIEVDASIRVPQPPQVRPSDQTAMREFLRRGGVAADIAQLQARLSRGLTARALDEQGVTAIAITARPDGVACALGRRGPRGEVDVWAPDRIHTMPGEMGCVPELVTHPPV